MRNFAKVVFLLLQLLLFAGLGPAIAAYSGTSHNSITIANPGEALNYYLALITVDTAAPIAATTMRADGGDIRFSNGSGTDYNFWIESGLNTATTKIWVKVSPLPSGYTTFGYYYGDATATHTNAASKVFGLSIVMLYTFTEGSGATVNDWVGGYDLTLSGGAAWTDGPRTGIGAVTNFDTGGRLAAADNGYDFGTGDFTVFAIVNPTADDIASTGTRIMNSYVNDGANGWRLKFQLLPGQVMLLTNAAGDFCQGSGGNVAADAWSMLGGRRWSNAFNTVFQNGIAVGDFCVNDARDVTNNSAILDLGRGSDGSAALHGSISMALLYSRNLSDVEVADLYNALIPTVQPTVSFGASSLKPVAGSDNYTTVQNTLLGVPAPGVLKNDTSSGGHSLTAAVSTYTTHGTLSLNANGSFLYMPDADFIGKDTFVYTVNDGIDNGNNGTVTINVVADNDTCSTLTITPIKKFLSLLIPFRVITLSVPEGADFPLGEDINWGTYAIKTLRVTQTETSNTVKAFVMLRPFQLAKGEYTVSVGNCEGTLEVQ